MKTNINDIKSYAGLFVIALAALFMLIVYLTDNVTNTTLAISGGLAVIGLLVQVFIGRAVDY